MVNKVDIASDKNRIVIPIKMVNGFNFGDKYAFVNNTEVIKYVDGEEVPVRARIKQHGTSNIVTFKLIDINDREHTITRRSLRTMNAGI